MRAVKASGEITMQCGLCGSEDSLSLDSLGFVPQQAPGYVDDNPDPIFVATRSIKCGNCHEEMGITMEVKLTPKGRIEDFAVSTVGCMTVESYPEIRKMIEID